MSPFRQEILLPAQVELITWTTAKGALYGLAFALYISSARLLYVHLQDQERRKQNLFTLVYISLIMALALFDIAVDSRNIQVSYVDHADYSPDGGLGYSLGIFTKLPINTVAFVASLLLQFLMSGIQIWRLWVVWKASRYSNIMMILPVLSFFADLGFQVTAIVIFLRFEMTRHLNVVISYGDYTSQLIISITTTIPIIMRIVMVRRRTMRVMGEKTNITSPYTSVISMLVESFALELVWIVVELPLILLDSSNRVAYAVDTFFSATQPIINTLAYLMVVYRVSTGRAWKEDTAEKLTSLQWNRGRELESAQIATQATIATNHEDV